MSRGFKPKHPEKLRGVIASAVLDRGLSVPAALRLLTDGRLPGWPGRYDLPLTSAQGYVTAEKQRRREQLLHRADPGTVQTAIAGQVALILTELDRRARAISKTTSLDEMRDLARAQRELLLTARACKTAEPGKHEPTPSDSAKPTSPGLIEQLANAETSGQPR